MDERFIWVGSNEIISEYREIIGQSYGLNVTIFVLESLISAKNFQQYEPSYKWQLVEKDPDDRNDGPQQICGLCHRRKCGLFSKR